MISGRAPSKDLKPKRPVATPQPGLLKRYLSRFDDGEVVRWAFRGLLLGAIGTLAIDLRDLSAEMAGGIQPPRRHRRHLSPCCRHRSIRTVRFPPTIRAAS